MKARYKILYFIFFLMSIIPSIYSLEVSRCIDTRGLNISWAHGMNNNIRVIHFNKGVKYFKECKKKVDIKSYTLRILKEYFEEYLPNDIPHDKKLLMATLSDAENMKKFSNAGPLWDKKSPLSRYIRGELNSEHLGIPTTIANKLSINLKDLFLYSSRELVQRCISTNIKDGERQTTLAVKQLATYELAKYLGIENVVVKSEFVKLITNHGNKVGVLTQKTDGVEIPKLKDKKLKINPKFQLELTNLQILDTITNELDHNPGNCSFKISNNQLVGVMAFDNEGGFGTNTSLKNGLCWGQTSPLLTEDKRINLPHISKNLAKKILNTQDADLDKLLKDILSEEQLSSLKTRFNKIKDAIKNTTLNNSKFLLSDNQWSTKTLSEELSGNYGKTYLIHYLKNLNLINK